MYVERGKLLEKLQRIKQKTEEQRNERLDYITIDEFAGYLVCEACKEYNFVKFLMKSRNYNDLSNHFKSNSHFEAMKHIATQQSNPEQPQYEQQDIDSQHLPHNIDPQLYGNAYFTKSTRGTNILNIGDYQYYFLVSRKDGTYWRCSKYNLTRCNAQAVFKNNSFPYTLKNEHTCNDHQQEPTPQQDIIYRTQGDIPFLLPQTTAPAPQYWNFTQQNPATWDFGTQQYVTPVILRAQEESARNAPRRSGTLAIDGGRSRRGGRSSRRGSSRPEEPTGQEHSTVYETGQRSDDPKRKGKAIDINVEESDTE
uniref:FLYWCH-type domain-containing protein n=1 Tax=Meloidogyne javanica TaxID=6303 RepID=A0A915N404_MELJA